MAHTINRTCISCRRMIPSNPEGDLLAFFKVTASYSEKTGKMLAKFKQGTVDALCPSCTDKFNKLIEEQKQKGTKVL